jgi:S-adenosylmethionine hydrolase
VRPIALLTDFGSGSVYVGQVHATLARLVPEARVLDLAHDCPAGHVEAGAYLLESSLPYLPDDAVVVAVVDPGVGSARSILAVEQGGRAFVAPDNGLLAPVLAGAAVHRLDAARLGVGTPSATFHGRDLMAPAAARLARGRPVASLGPPAEPLRPALGATATPDVVEGAVLLVDPFGNLVTNVRPEDLERLCAPLDWLRVTAGPLVLTGLRRTFADVAEGSALAYLGSGGRLEVAVNRGRASDRFGLGVGAPVRVECEAS